MEKYSNIDYLEYELDMYNLLDSKRKHELDKNLEKIKIEQEKNSREEIFKDDDDEGELKASKGLNEMRETRTGFGNKVKGSGGIV